MNQNQLHTPGPWMAFYEYHNGPLRVGASTNCTVAAIYMPPVGDMEANARLIAAAPELLAALENYLIQDEIAEGFGGGVGGCARTQAIAAIAKATGAQHEN